LAINFAAFLTWHCRNSSWNF